MRHFLHLLIIIIKINIVGDIFMPEFGEYNLAVYSIYKYVKLTCKDRYFNENFDKLLLIIGKCYFNKPDKGVNGVCSLIRDEINKEWHLNGLRKSKQLKKVTTKQIKTIRRSFRAIGNKNENYICVPFNVISIFFFILHLFKLIDDEILEKKEYMRSMKDDTIKEFLYKYHSKIFKKEYDNIIFHLTEEKLIKNYNELYANLEEYESFFNDTYSNIDWNKLSKYAIR